MTRDTRQRFYQALRHMEPVMRRAFIQAIRDVRSTAQMRLIEDAAARGDVKRITEILRLGPDFFAPLDDALSETFIRGGAYVLASLPKRNPATGEALVVRFQGRHARATSWLNERAGGLITEIVEDQRVLIQEALRRGLESGQNPRTTALDLVGRMQNGRRTGGLIGLTSREAEYVSNLRRELSDPATASGYFDRRARDRRFDRTVARAIREGRALSPADIERISGRYSDRLLARRGERIARTETIAALHAGRQEGWAQVIDSGEVDAAAITKTWKATGDARTRDIHTALNGVSVRHGEPFQSPTGARLQHPGDTSQGASGEDTINCRCWMETRVDWLSMAR